MQISAKLLVVNIVVLDWWKDIFHLILTPLTIIINLKKVSDEQDTWNVQISSELDDSVLELVYLSDSDSYVAVCW